VEDTFVDWLLARLPTDGRLEVPPGDDAAVLRPPAMRRTVVTTDMLAEGVDFLLGDGPGRCRPRDVGRKAMAVNLSDLAAMAARPEAAVIAVNLPREGGDAIGRELLEGLLEVAVAFDVALAGGDTNAWDGGLVVSVTAIGSVPPGRAWRRDGARPGDAIVVTGRFGGSLLGRHLSPIPRCREATAIAEQFPVHAAIDVSDGLSLDLARLARASGVAAWIDPEKVPIHDDAFLAAAADPGGRSPLDRALGDGEDFELVLTMPADAAEELLAAAPDGMELARIGGIVSGEGLHVRKADGSLAPLPVTGFLHRFDGQAG
jgi:thiamine-monophosphate kinase